VLYFIFACRKKKKKKRWLRMAAAAYLHAGCLSAIQCEHFWTDYSGSQRGNQPCIHHPMT